MKKNLIWLASYPKSGNTWLRIFLANYLANKDEPLAINEVRPSIGDSFAKHYMSAAGGPLDLTDYGRVLQYRDPVLRAIAANGADVNLVKTHNRRTAAWGVPLMPEAYTRGAIYIMRNPLDMVLSYARHFGLSHARAVEAICRSDNAIAPDEKTVAQFLGSWQDHVESWTATAPYPQVVLRYEDMLYRPVEAFGKVMDLFGVPRDTERLERAIRHSSFDELSKQESEAGFIEKSPSGESFFVKGESGYWKDELDPDLVRKVRRANKRAMKAHGYWNDT